MIMLIRNVGGGKSLTTQGLDCQRIQMGGMER